MKFTCKCGETKFFLQREDEGVLISAPIIIKVDHLFDYYERNNNQYWHAYCHSPRCFLKWGPGDCLEELENIMIEAGVLE